MAPTEDDLLSELKSIHAFLTAARTSRPRQQYASISRVLEKLARILKRPLRVAVLGEENSGKSLLINYLLRHQVLPSGGFSGESTELLIHYASEPSVHSISTDGSRNRLTSKAFGRLVKPEIRRAAVTQGFIYDASSNKRQTHRSEDPGDLIFSKRKKSQTTPRLIEVGLPLSFLKRIELVEVRAFPEEMAASPSSRAFRRVDATIWCTLATQAWKETEILAWKRIPLIHRKSALMLVTYKDAIRRGKDEAKILARLHHATAPYFDDVVLVSLRDAVQSLLNGDAETAKRFRAGSNIETAETALAKMIGDWQIQRLRKVSRILRMAAAKVAGLAQGRDMIAVLDIAARLDRLASEFLDVPPLASLSNRAA